LTIGCGAYHHLYSHHHCRQACVDGCQPKMAKTKPTIITGSVFLNQKEVRN